MARGIGGGECLETCGIKIFLKSSSCVRRIATLSDPVGVESIANR